MVTLANRVKVNTSTTGTGTITLGSAVEAFQTFADGGVTNGQTVRYTIEDDNGGWEVGTGVYSSTGPTLTRSPSESSNADAAINLSGSARVFVTAAAADLQHAADMDQGVATTDDVAFASVQLTGGSGSQGTMSWNTDEETVDLIQNGATLQVGQEVHWHCRNSTGSTIANGTPVMATGTIGASSRITIAPMGSTTQSNAKFFIGVATEDIAAGTDGKVTHFGKVRGIDTSAYSDGDVLYLDPTTDGGFTATEPTSGMNIPAAFVVTSHASVGAIAVRVNTIDENHFATAAQGALADSALQSSDIGVSVQGYSANTVIDGSYVHTDNNYTTTEKNKLAGIEAGATADQTASEILTAIKTVDGAASGLDADLLDGNHASAFATSGHSHSDATTLASGFMSAADKAKLDGVEAGATADQTAAEILTAIKTVDGATSGLDADLLDGQHGSYYTGYTDTAIASLVDTAPTTLNTLNELAAALGDDPNFATTVSASIGTKLDASAYTAADVLTKIKTVDGASSGLDADLLDGNHASAFSLTSHNHTLDGLSNTTITSNTSGEILKWNGTAWINNTLAEAGIQPAGSYLTTASTFGGDVSGTYNAIVVADDSHNHIISNVDGLQTALDGKYSTSGGTVSGSITATGNVTASAFYGNGANLTGIVSIPAGVIVMWSGSIVSIPSGWVICDGLNSTPDLRDRFIVGAGSTYAVAATGGASNVTLATTQIPSHTHSFSANATTGGGGAHTPAGSVDGGGAHTPAGNISNAGNHTHTGSTSNTGAHTHTLTKYFAWGYQNVPGGSSEYNGAVNNTTSSAGAHSHNFTTAGGGAHGHNFTGTAVGNHTHTFTGTAVGNHTHSVAVSGTSGATGGAGAHENKPPYYALAYIMKT